MRLDVITDHTESVLNLMMDKAIRECDPEYGRVAATWYTMAEGALFLWQELAECCTEVSQEEKNKMAQRLRHIINVNRVPLLKKKDE